MSQGGVNNLGSLHTSTVGLGATQTATGTGEALGLQPGEKVEASQTPTTTATKIDGPTTETTSQLKSTGEPSTKASVTTEKQSRAFAKDNGKASDAFKPGTLKDGKSFKSVDGHQNLVSKGMKKSFEREFNSAVRSHPDFKTGKMTSDTLKGLAETAVKTVVKKEVDSLKDSFKTDGKNFSKLDGAKGMTPTQKTEVDKYIDDKLSKEPGATDGTMNPGKVKEIAKKAVEYADGLSKTGLSSDIDKMIAKSPTLKEGVTKLNTQGWTVRFTADGDTQGSYCDRTTTTIVVDKNDKKNVEECVTTMAHEVGHALYTPDAEPNVLDPSMTKEKYKEAGLSRNFKDEGAAVLNNCKVRDELKSLGYFNREKIGVAGERDGDFQVVYDKVKKGTITEDEGRAEIGTAFRTLVPSTDPNSNYAEYYGKPYEQHWDDNHPVVV